jgi:hypothetical protein
MQSFGPADAYGSFSSGDFGVYGAFGPDQEEPGPSATSESSSPEDDTETGRQDSPAAEYEPQGSVDAEAEPRAVAAEDASSVSSDALSTREEQAEVASTASQRSVSE